MKPGETERNLTTSTALRVVGRVRCVTEIFNSHASGKGKCSRITPHDEGRLQTPTPLKGKVTSDTLEEQPLHFIPPHTRTHAHSLTTAHLPSVSNLPRSYANVIIFKSMQLKIHN